MSELDNFVQQFTDRKIENVIEISHAFYQVSAQQAELIKKIRDKAKKEPRAAGTILGEMHKGRFRPSIALIDMISVWTDRRVTIDSKSEWLFLCDRDVFASSVKKASVRRGLVIVQNEAGETLGYGDMTGKTRDDDIAVKNILDKGNFLRREN